MSTPNIQPVILCGGSGTRLWPLSRVGFPKQFLCLTGTDALLREAGIQSAPFCWNPWAATPRLPSRWQPWLPMLKIFKFTYVVVAWQIAGNKYLAGVKQVLS